MSIALGRARLVTVALTLIGSAAHAAPVDVSSIFSNLGFENGNLVGWTPTQPNADYVASLAPPVNPSIDPADPANDPTTLTAPAGSYFTGLKRPTDVGADVKYKLAHDATAILVPAGTTFEVRVWANRGRLEPFDTPASTADVLVRIFGWNAGSTPTVNAADNWSRTVTWNPPAQSFDFTGVADGTWALRTFAFDPGALASTLRFLAVSVAGRNQNHDQYVAIDIVSEPALGMNQATWSAVKGLFRDVTP